MIIPFPIDINQQLTLDQAVSVVKNRKPKNGIIVFYDEDDDIGIFNFGEVSRRDALWIAEQVKRHSLGEEIL